MFLDCLQAHLSVCSQGDLPTQARLDPDFWNLISIREADRPRIDSRGFLKVQGVVFDDVGGTEGLEEIHGFQLPRREHLQEIFGFADSVAGEPLLVHCWAGVSRSTAVALGIIVRALHQQGCSQESIEVEAPSLLLEIRPQAAPNPLVLQLALELIVEAHEVSPYLQGLLNHPGLFRNRYPGAEPG